MNIQDWKIIWVTAEKCHLWHKWRKPYRNSREKMHFLFDLSEIISLKINTYQNISVKQNCKFDFFLIFWWWWWVEPLGSLPFLRLSAIMAETMQKRGILPPFCATRPTPPVQNIAIPATQKLTDCVSNPIGYPPSHLHANTPKKRS